MKILVVEDESSIREVISAYLRKEKFEVYEASSGTRALELFNFHKFDLVLLDLNLPGIDGIEVCKRIRLNSNVPIIMVTARIQDIDELTGLNIGADDYIKKPFNPSVLVARVRAVLKRNDTTEVLIRGNIEINPATCVVTVKSNAVELTSTEFNIIHLLASNPGRVYNRDEIIDRAYSKDFASEILDRTIDVHIKNIRKKIKNAGEDGEIVKTVVGKGYKFNEAYEKLHK